MHLRKIHLEFLVSRTIFCDIVSGVILHLFEAFKLPFLNYLRNRSGSYYAYASYTK